MTNDYEPDPVLMALARLPSVRARPDCDARTRMRCHTMLARREAQSRPTPDRAPVARAADFALTVVLCGYAMMALVEAIRLMQ
jgi:hypothetical protein